MAAAYRLRYVWLCPGLADRSCGSYDRSFEPHALYIRGNPRAVLIHVNREPSPPCPAARGGRATAPLLPHQA